MIIEIIDIFIVIGIVLLAVTLHEAMHAFAGYWLGDDTAVMMGRLTLNPVAHIDPFLTLLLPIFLAVAGLPVFGAAKPVPFNPSRVKYGEYGAALVAVAGPITNFLLAVAGAISIRLLGLDAGLLSDILVSFVVINLGFFVFNMIPFPPLDGSRLLYSLSPESVRDVMRRIESFGLLGVGLFIILGSSIVFSIVSRSVSALFLLLTGHNLL